MANSPMLLSGKRILFGITKSNWGGAQVYVYELAKAAKASGAEVLGMAGSASGVQGEEVGLLFEKLEEEGVRTISLREIVRNLGIAAEWRAFRELRAIIATEKPDVLHLNSSKMGLLGALAGRLSGVPTIIFTAHGWPHREQKPLWWKMVAWIGSWSTIILCSKIICVSDYDLRTSPVLLFRDKLVHISNGIASFTLLDKTAARTKLSEHAPTLENFSTWLFMNAELHPNKGISTAIRALAELKDDYPTLALVVCGEGEERARLERLAAELGVSKRVFLLGFVPNARTYLNAADLYLLPSLKEGMPIALLEAGIASLPVIASGVGGIPELILDQKTGLWMPRSNTQILTKAISFLLQNHELAQSFGKNLHDHVLTNFSQEKMASNTVALY